MIATNFDVYIEGIEREIINLKNKNIRYLFRPADEIHPDVLTELVRYMKNKKYDFKYRKCPQCTNQYEIIIDISNLVLDKNNN